jgi:hypothetical protein
LYSVKGRDDNGGMLMGSGMHMWVWGTDETVSLHIEPFVMPWQRRVLESQRQGNMEETAIWWW